MIITKAFFGGRRILYGMLRDEDGAEHRLLYYERRPLPGRTLDADAILSARLNARRADELSAEAHGGLPLLRAAATPLAAEYVSQSESSGGLPRVRAEMTPFAAELTRGGRIGAGQLESRIAVMIAVAGLPEPKELRDGLRLIAAMLDARADFAAGGSVADARLRADAAGFPIDPAPPGGTAAAAGLTASPTQLPEEDAGHPASAQELRAEAELSALPAGIMTPADGSACRVCAKLEAEPCWFDFDPETGVLTIYQSIDYSASGGTLTIN